MRAAPSLKDMAHQFLQIAAGPVFLAAAVAALFGMGACLSGPADSIVAFGRRTTPASNSGARWSWKS
jgi:hypothetical protein